MLAQLRCDLPLRDAVGCEPRCLLSCLPIAACSLPPRGDWGRPFGARLGALILTNRRCRVTAGGGGVAGELDGQVGHRQQYQGRDRGDQCRDHRRHCAGIGTVPMQSPRLAVQELERCMEQLNLQGVQIGSHIGDWNLDAPELLPFFEAAQDLGANAWQRFRHVTLPMLMPILAVVLTFSVLFTFTDFQLVYAITRGGPINSTHLMATLAFQRGIPGGQLGEGAAIAVAMIPFLVMATLFSYFALARRKWQQGEDND